MRKGFLHDRLGSGGRSCQGDAATWTLTSGESPMWRRRTVCGDRCAFWADRSGWLVGWGRGAAGRGCPGRLAGPVRGVFAGVFADVIEGGRGTALAGAPVVPYAGAVPDGGRQGS